MPRYKICIEYDGSDFCGWQRQKNGISVQEAIEEAISKFSFQKTIVEGSGRTDAGVHAIMQVAHFDIDKQFDPNVIEGAINHFVKPNKVGVFSCELMSDDFHARFSCVKRTYVYKIINRKNKAIIDEMRCWWVQKHIDEVVMINASKFLIGTHDFTSFRASKCQAKSPIKTINEIKIERYEDEIRILISARSFLHHMVRNIVGTLVQFFGIEGSHPEEMLKILNSKSRCNSGITAPARGLYFLSSEY